ncbi:MAG: CheR family methyltransferase, partial [Gemmatimonadales bacterium]
SSGVWGMDLIVCRNVLIYFDAETIARVAEAMLATLADDGWLVLGASDPALGEIVRCEVVQTPSGVSYRKYRGSLGRVRPELMPSIAPRQPEVPMLPLVVDAPEASEPAETQLPLARDIPPVAVDESLAMRAYLERDYEQAAAIVARRIQAADATVADRVVNVRALANLGHLDEAAQACVAALDRHRDNPQLHYMHAVLLAEKGLFAEAARAAKRALYLDRNMIVAHLALGGVMARWGKDVVASQRSFAAAERLLSVMPPDQLVPDSDGEPAGRLIEMTRAQSRLLPGSSAPIRELNGSNGG